MQHLSYAGITLPLQTPQHEEWLRAIHPPKSFVEFDGWNFDQPNNGNIPTPSIPTPPEFRVGVLQWYTGASRPSWFRAVVNTTILDQIRTVVADPMTPQSLLMNDGRSSKTVTASMYMLPPRPLNQLGHASSDGWLLTLTDQRFYWYFRRCSITEQPSSWSVLYQTIASALGISLTVEEVNSNYGVPSTKWASYSQPTPALLDAVAAQVGQRIVVGLDGSVITSNWEAARDNSDFYIAAADPIISGGVYQQSDIARYVPASVKVLFIDTTEAPPAAEPHEIEETLTSLAVDGYGSSAGLTGFYQTLFADTPYDGSNTTEVNNYAEQAATDWYGWRLADLYAVWPGIEPWIPTGWEDCIEWTIQKRGDQPFASTSVRRGPWSSMQSGNWYAGLEPSPTITPTDCAPGCGWFAGMEDVWCLDGTVLNSDGRCEDIGSLNLDGFHLRWDSGTSKFVSQEWDDGTSAWVDYDFVYDTGQGPLRVWYASDTDQIAASVNDIDLALDCCGDNFAVFSGGIRASSALCDGTVPTTPCSPNTFRVKVECGCCYPDGFTEDGYYCVVGAGEECGVDEVTVIPLDSDDICDFEGVICDGPYATEEEANAACMEVPPPTCTDRDPSTLPATLNWAAVALVGDGVCANGASGIMEEGMYGQGPNAWATPSLTPCAGDPASFPLDLRLACTSGQYRLYASTSAGTCNGLTASNYPVSGTATPFKLVFNIPSCWWKSDANPADTIQITITE